MKNKIFLLFLGLVTFSCKDSLTDPNLESINGAKAKWKSANITSYTLDQARFCNCLDSDVFVRISVTNNIIVDVTDTLGVERIPTNMWSNYKTVDQLFDIIYDVRNRNVSQLQMDFNEQYGYPTMIAVNPSDMVIGDEYGYTCQKLTRR